MPQRLYFACNWTILPVEVKTLELVTSIANSLDCVMLTSSVQKDSRGIFVFPIQISTVSDENLHKLLKAIEPYIKLENFTPIQEDKFTGQPLAPYLNPFGFNDVVRDIGLRNLNRLKELQSK